LAASGAQRLNEAVYNQLTRAFTAIGTIPIAAVVLTGFGTKAFVSVPRPFLARSEPGGGWP
jgi:enoyl-CoA hydratase/carnithine racemase